MTDRLEEEKPAGVSKVTTHAGEIRARWAWVEPSVWSERMLMALENLPGKIVPEGAPAKGSIFNVHFGHLVAQSDVASMVFAAAGWTFQAMSGATYGHYWAATPTAEFHLAPGKCFDITVGGLKAVANAVQAQVTTDIDGVSDGVFVDLVIIQQSSSLPPDNALQTFGRSVS